VVIAFKTGDGALTVVKEIDGRVTVEVGVEASSVGVVESGDG